MKSRLEGPFVLGKSLTLLDVILFCELSWYQAMGLYPEGIEYLDRFMANFPKK